MHAGRNAGINRRHRWNALRAGLCLSLSLTMLPAGLPLSQSAALAAKTQSEHVKKTKKTKKSAEFNGTGLDPTTLDQINHGSWNDALERLQKLTAGEPAGTRNNAWLAFAYMFFSRCDELDALSEKARATFDARDAANLPPLVSHISGTKAGAKDQKPGTSATDSGAAATGTATATTGTSAPATSSAAKPAATSSTSASSATSADKEHAAAAAIASAEAMSTGQATVLQPPAPHGLVPPSPKRTPADDAQTYAVLIQVYNAICHQNYRDADAEMVLLPRTYDNDALVNFTLAALSGKEGRASDAVAYTQRTVEEAPDFAWGYRTLGRLQQNRLKDLRHADQSYQAALAITPDLADIADSLVELRTGQNNFDGAIEVAQAAITSDPKSSANHYRLALIYAQQYRNREASAELEKSISIDPGVAKYYRSRAAIKRAQGDLNDAIADEQHAVDLSKDKPFELVELAAMNQAAGNVNRAADNLQDALKLDPDNQDAHNKLVTLLEQEKRYDDLIAEYKRLAERKPKDAAARLGLAGAYVAVDKLDLAAKEFVAAANLDPNNPEPHRQMGAIKLKEKHYGAAAKEYTAALNINPSSVPDLVALGHAYAQNDDYPQAEAAFVTALALQQLTQPNTLVSSPARLDLMRSLAALLLDEGRYSEAAAQFQAIYASSKGTGNAAMDYFMLSQAKTLRDLSNASAQALIDSFHALNQEQQNGQRNALLSSLVEANKADLVLPLIEEQLKTANQDQQMKLKYLKARALLKQGKVADARKSVSDMVPADADGQPSDVSGELVTLSQLSAAADDLTQSETLAQKAVEKYSKSYNAYTQLGRIKLREGKAKEAIDFANRAIELNPYATKAYLLKGDAQESAGNVKDASANYRRAAELYPGLLEAHKALLDTLRKLSLKDEAKREEEQIAQMEKQQ